MSPQDARRELGGGGAAECAVAEHPAHQHGNLLVPIAAPAARAELEEEREHVASGGRGRGRVLLLVEEEALNVVQGARLYHVWHVVRAECEQQRLAWRVQERSDRMSKREAPVAGHF